MTRLAQILRQKSTEMVEERRSMEVDEDDYQNVDRENPNDCTYDKQEEEEEEVQTMAIKGSNGSNDSNDSNKKKSINITDLDLKVHADLRKKAFELGIPLKNLTNQVLTVFSRIKPIEDIKSQSIEYVIKAEGDNLNMEEWGVDGNGADILLNHWQFL